MGHGELTVAGAQEDRTSLLRRSRYSFLPRSCVQARWLLDHCIGDFYQLLFDTTERESREDLRRAAHELGIGTYSMNDTWRLLGRVLAHTGKSLRHITSADLLELREAVHGTGHVLSGHFTVTRLLYHLGIVTEPLLSPSYFRTVRPTVGEIVDGFGIRNLRFAQAFVLY